MTSYRILALAALSPFATLALTACTDLTTPPEPEPMANESSNGAAPTAPKPSASAPTASATAATPPPRPAASSIPAPDDVAAAPATAKKTASGLAYKVLKPGTGASPKATDNVTVSYTGWTTDGKMVDSSVKRGKPATFPLNHVIKGWTEGVQLMKVGEKVRFWIPAELAYGEHPAGGRPGGAARVRHRLDQHRGRSAPRRAPARPSVKLRVALAATLPLAALAACGGVPQRTTDAPASSASAGAIAPADIIQIGGGGPGPASSPAASGSAASGGARTPDTIVARHILIQYIGCKRADSKIVRTREQALKVAEEVERRLKAGDDFGHLVVDFSDEPNASSRGGSLGRFGHGVMDKVFENAAFKLKPGEISPVIETSFGFHVIQRMD